jgi:hypothetical protein
VGGLFYWLLTRQLVTRARDPKAWAAALTGVAACALGYAPAFLFDHQNFVNTYWLREQLQKGSNGRTWDYVMKPLLHFMLPWTFVVVGAVPRLIRARKPKAPPADLPMVKLGLAMALPTIAFWCLWSYKGQNYNLPAIPALLLFGWAAYDGAPPRWATATAGLLGLLAGFIAVGVVSHFSPLPDWWATAWVTLAFVAIAAFAAAFLLSEDVRVLAAGAVAFCLAFGASITPLGEHEMTDARVFLGDHPEVTYHYYNLDPSIWSEWAILELALHHPIYGLHRRQQLAEATRPGHAVMVQNMDNLNVVLGYWRKNVRDRAAADGGGARPRQPVVTPWTRWLTKGHSPDGRSQWSVAWETRDLRVLEREFFIVYFPAI